MQAPLHKIISRLMKRLTRQGVLIEEEEGGTSYLTDADSDEARSHRPLQAAACTRRNDLGPHAGQKVFTMPRRHATRRRAYPEIGRAHV